MALQSVYDAFNEELSTLFLLDQKNQYTLAPNSKQIFIINEAILGQAFRCLENFLENSFLEYASSQPTLLGKAVTSYLNPLNLEHAYELVKSSHNFLEWNAPETIIKRAEVYLQNGGPIKTVVAAKVEVFKEMKKIRNHIAHNSRESLDAYEKVVRKHYGTSPLSIPSPGQYLQLISKTPSKDHYLKVYLSEIAVIGNALVN